MTKRATGRGRAVLLAVVAILVGILTIGTQTALMYSASLDFALGKGERHVAEADVSAENTAYYAEDYPTALDSQKAASEVVKKIVAEGAVLMKNEGEFLPLDEKAAITPIGYHYLVPFYGGSGSATFDTTAEYVVTPEKAFSTYFTVNEEALSAMKAAEPVTMIYDDGNADTDITEFDKAVYEGVAASCADTTGIVFISRPGEEGFDANSRVPYEDGTETQMELTIYEKALVAFAKESCAHVVVIINSPSQVEITELDRDDAIEAILWIGTPGATGFDAVGQILCGKVNPSGRTPDIWYADFKSDPTYINHLATPYTNIEDGMRSFLEYEEGIYMGYRYYETRFAEDNAFSVFGETKTYDEAVVYPFGYGLHFENDKISQALGSVSYKDGMVTVTGTIKNDSSRDVMETVEIYLGAPYTRGGIEKSAKELAAFDKLAVKAGGTADFEVSFALEDLASYDYKGIYSAEGSYVLESGEYQVYLGKNSHEEWGKGSFTLNDTLVFADEAKSGQAVGKRNSDETAAVNLLNYIRDYEESGTMTVMSRADFAGTYPTAPAEKEATAASIAEMQIDYDNDPVFGLVEGSEIYRDTFPTSKAGNGITVSSLRGLPYDDPMWDELLDNLDYEAEDVSELMTRGLYMTAKVESIGLVETTDHDGTTGLTATWSGDDNLAGMFGMTSSRVEAACGYPSCGIQAATFNVKLLREMGEMIGAESLTNKINGWYAPGLNLHSTPYGGRNFEYYSEDPVLSGYAASAIVSGAFTSGGLTAYVKHFALNETDDDRSGVAVWANEQVCRELYFRAFEMFVKNAEGTETYYDGEAGELKTVEVSAARGLMTSMNYIGSKSPTNSYALLTRMLRGEWGFEGAVITDFTSGTYKRNDLGYRYGNDLWMGIRTVPLDLTTPTAQWAARKAVHNIAYITANSNAYNHVAPGSYAYYDQSPWMKALQIIDVTGAFICLLLCIMLLRVKKGKGEIVNTAGKRVLGILALLIAGAALFIYLRTGVIRGFTDELSLAVICAIAVGLVLNLIFVFVRARTIESLPFAAYCIAALLFLRANANYLVAVVRAIDVTSVSMTFILTLALLAAAALIYALSFVGKDTKEVAA